MLCLLVMSREVGCVMPSGMQLYTSHTVELQVAAALELHTNQFNARAAKYCKLTVLYCKPALILTCVCVCVGLLSIVKLGQQKSRVSVDPVNSISMSFEKFLVLLSPLSL